jgi:pSer/pThr/pTyr-binding forkhead associated (FHA) protein
VVPGVVLTLLKFGLLLALYLFLARALRTVAADLYGPRRRSAPPPRAPVAAPAETPRKSRKIPREVVVYGPSGPPAVTALSDVPLTFGRAAGLDVVLDDVYASDEHLGSTNGTFLNGAKLTRPMPIASGDQLRLGKTRVEVRR